MGRVVRIVGAGHFVRRRHSLVPGALQQNDLVRAHRDNIQYFLGDEELEGLRTFYRYAAEAGLVSGARELTFF